MVKEAFVAPSTYRIAIPRHTAADFFALCELNPDIPFEREAYGTIVIMSPVTSLGGLLESLLFERLAAWNLLAGKGKLFNSSSGFTLPNGAVRSPDVSWVSSDRWQSLTKAEKNSFAQITPDFVAEVRSKSDNLKQLEAKLDEYIVCGVRLAWLIDPLERRATIYRPGRAPEVLSFEATLSGEEVLPGFAFPLSALTAELDA